MNFLSRFKEVPPAGYEEVSLAQVLAVLAESGLSGVGSLGIDDLTRVSGHGAMPTSGGGYSPLGQYQITLGRGGDAKIVGKKIYIKRGVDAAKELEESGRRFFVQYGFHPGNDVDG